MADASVAHVFLDVNVALHFKRADQIDWCALAGAAQVVLVVAPVFLDELEYQKVHNPSRKLRERADGSVNWLAQFLRSPRSVRPGVTSSFLDHEPHVDFAAHRLSPATADDQLIASVLDHLQTFTGRVSVATADIGLEVKLRARRIEPLLLPDDLRLPAEPDAVEKELQQTRQELARLKSRFPRLELSFDNGADRLELTFAAPPSAPSTPSLSETLAKYPPLAKPGSPPPRTGLPGIGGLAGALAGLQAFGLSAERIDRYNQDDDLPKRPEAPKPPQRPGGLELVRSDLSGGDPAGYLFHRPLTDFKVPDLDGLPTVDMDRHQVRFSLRSLKHAFRQTFLPFHCRFPTRKAIRSFHVDFHVSAAELPEALTGQIHLIVKG